MYAKYNYSGSATLMNVLNDIRDVITDVVTMDGSNHPTNLSAGCDTANSFVLKTYNAAGWTLHDSTCKSIGTVTFSNVGGNLTMNKGTSSILSAGMPVRIEGGVAPTGVTLHTECFVCTTGLGASAATLATSYANAMAGTPIAYTDAGSGTKTLWSGAIQTFKQAYWDDGSNFTYMQLDVYTANYLYLHIYETWNATTHAGTNQSVDAGANWQQRLKIGTGGTMAIGSKSSHVMFQSTTSDGIGATTSGDWIGSFQRSRAGPSDTVAAAHPPVVSLCGSIFNATNPFGLGNGTAVAPRYRNPIGGDLTGSNAPVGIGGLCWTAAATGTGAGAFASAASAGGLCKKISDGIGGFFTPNSEIFAQNGANGFMGGSISAICDVWMSVAYPNNLDEVVINGKQYILWQNTNTPLAGGALVALLKG